MDGIKKTDQMHVIDFMKPAAAISQDTEISKALKLLKNTDSGFLSVVDGEHILIGAVSENNFIRLVRNTPASPLEEYVWYDEISQEDGKKPVGDIMTANITTVRPNDDIKTTLKVMNSGSYRLIHVTDADGKLLGVIRLSDIFEKLLEV